MMSGMTSCQHLELLQISAVLSAITIGAAECTVCLLMPPSAVGNREAYALTNNNGEHQTPKLCNFRHCGLPNGPSLGRAGG